MFRKMAEEIVFFLLCKGILDSDKREVYEYAVEVILLNGGLLCTTFLISVLLHKFREYLLFLIIFLPLRVTLGGMHLESSLLCMIWSNILYAGMLIIAMPLYQNYRIPECCFFILLGIVSYCLPPLHDGDKAWHNKKLARIFILLYTIIGVVGVYFQWWFAPIWLLYCMMPELFFVIAKKKT